MGILRAASGATKRIMLDETDYIEVREDISKREFNLIAANMPSTPKDAESISLPEATKFQKFLFVTLVTGWSLSEGTPTEEQYEGLSAEAANAVDEKVAQHFEGLVPSSAEEK